MQKPDGNSKQRSPIGRRYTSSPTKCKDQRRNLKHIRRTGEQQSNWLYSRRCHSTTSRHLGTGSQPLTLLCQLDHTDSKHKNLQHNTPSNAILQKSTLEECNRGCRSLQNASSGLHKHRGAGCVTFPGVITLVVHSTSRACRAAPTTRSKLN